MQSPSVLSTGQTANFDKVDKVLARYRMLDLAAPGGAIIEQVEGLVALHSMS